MSAAPGRTFRLAALDDFVTDGVRGFALPDMEVVIVSEGGRHHAYENRCPHRGTSLDWAPGRYLSEDGRFLQCATHGALFEKHSGRCVSGPCTGDRLRPLALCELDGYLCVTTP